jgi:hypothetical protein
MFLKQKSTQGLVEIITLRDLWDPCITEVTGRLHAGQEMQDPETFSKADLMFPSNEALPACWLDADYRHQSHHDDQLKVMATHR